jgi:hypothetical protein
VFISLLAGINRANRSFSLLILLLVANLLFAVPIVTPLFSLFLQTTARTLGAQRMFADKLDAVWFIDLINNRFPDASLLTASAATLSLLSLLGGLYLLLNLFLAGGILESFAAGERRFSARSFWAGCGVHFWRFLRLGLISLLFYGALFVAYQLVKLAIGRAEAQASAAQPIQLAKLALLLVFVLALALVNLAFDYARIGAVLRERRGMWRETIEAWRFSLAYFLQAYPLYLLLAALGTALFAGFAWWRSLVNQGSLLGVGLALGLGQLAILARLWTRLALYAGQLDFYQRHTPAPLVATKLGAPVIEFMPATGELPPLAAVQGTSEPAATAAPDDDEKAG